MKRAPRTKGLGWDVFHVGGYWPDHGTYEIHRVDCPVDPDTDADLVPAFRGDAAAVKHVFAQAKRGNADAIEALWTCADDPLVHLILWGCEHMAARHYAHYGE